MTPVQTLLRETESVIDAACGDDPRLRDMLATLKAGASRAAGPVDHGAAPPRHAGLLDRAIADMPDHPFGPLKSALAAAKDHLMWRVDDGQYYARGADVGAGYKTGNMHSLLIGPQHALIKDETILLGFFLLAPKTLYRDHHHLAPELYIPLTGPSGWRFDFGDWQDHDAGSVIYNAPDIVHATRVYDTPFLSLFAWSEDITAPCHVAPAPDWADIEARFKGA